MWASRRMPSLSGRYRVPEAPPEGWSLELGRYAPAEGLALASRLLFNRGIKDVNAALEFLNVDSAEIRDPFELPDMERAVELLLNAIKANKRITVYGDFDADGITATSILILALRKVGVDCQYYLPQRETEGHGISEVAIRKLAESGTELLVTVDTGTTAYREVELANYAGMDVVITDHHIPDDGKLPPAAAIVNPHLSDNKDGMADYCGAGIALKLAMGLLDRAGVSDYSELVPLAAIGTVADRTQLKGDNRVIVRHGLNRIETDATHGLIALVRKASERHFNRQGLGSDFIGFQLAPRLNAPGRLGSADISVELLTCDDYAEATQLAEAVDAKNLKRRELAREALESVQDQLVYAAADERSVVMVSLSDEYPLGMLGPLAGTLNDRTGRPAIVYQVNNELAKASARSRGEFDIHHALNGISHKLIRFGGHASAAGFQIRPDDIDEVTRHLEQQAHWDELRSEGNSALNGNGEPIQFVDAELELHQLGTAMWDFVKRLEPFGSGNEEPRFLIRNSKVAESRPVGKNGRQLVAMLTDFTGREYRAFGWGLGSRAPLPPVVDSVVSLRENHHYGYVRRELYLHDVAPSN